MKKIILYFLSIIIVLGSFCCCSNSNKKAETIRIAVALYKQDDTFITSISKHLQQLASEKELAKSIKINLNIADANNNQSIQNSQIDDFITQNYDILCVNIVDRTAAASIIDKAKNANIPIIFFNREPVSKDLARWDKAYYVGSPAANAGILQGGIVLDAWNENPKSIDKNEDNTIQYIMLEGENGHQDALLRTDYSVSTLKNSGITTQKLASATANWHAGQASAKMKPWIEEFGDEIELIFANNDEMALGAIDAYEQLGYKPEDLPFIVGVDAVEEALEAIEAGTLKGTVLNDSKEQASAIFDLAYALTLNIAIPNTVVLSDGNYAWQSYSKITIKNLYNFYEKKD